MIIVTTPNRDFNKFFNMKTGQFRHWDHQFEYNLEEMQEMCVLLASDLYEYTLSGIAYPDADRIEKQFKHPKEEFKDVPASFIAVFRLKTRGGDLYRVNGQMEVPFIQAPLCCFQFADHIQIQTKTPVVVEE